MIKKFLKIFALCAVCTTLPLGFSACGGDDDEPPTNGPVVPDNDGGDDDDDDDTPGTAPNNPALTPSDFAKGADVSWITRVESEGHKFYDADGNEAEAMRLLRDECGVNSIRLRVWVNPTDRWNGKSDVIEKAVRAHELGMRLMIDFHFSDDWADPGKQRVPAAWEGKNPEQMAAAVSDHVTDILSALRLKGITPEWVQIGNETTNGMLWESGRVAGTRTGEFVRYLNAGYDAVKEIFPRAKVIVHLDNGFDQGLYKWFFDLMQAAGAKYDMIGMSLYPEKESTDGGQWSVATDMAKVNTCMANIRAVNSRYGKPVVICEIGFHYTNGKGAATAISTIMNAFKGDNRLQGIFYWEPAIPQGYTGYNKGAFVDGRPTEALSPFTSEN